jgi:hypothetical protein
LRTCQLHHGFRRVVAALFEKGCNSLRIKP